MLFAGLRHSPPTSLTCRRRLPALLSSSLRPAQWRHRSAASTSSSRTRAMDGASEASGAAPSNSNDGGGSGGSEDVLLQYVILRRDLWGELGWPLGSVVAQGCHAATAALWLSRDSPGTQQYCSPENLDHMHKVVLEVKGEAQLRSLSGKLAEAGVLHKLWIEQPEDFATCIATAPYPKSTVQPHVKRLKLCKGA